MLTKLIAIGCQGGFDDNYTAWRWRLLADRSPLQATGQIPVARQRRNPLRLGRSDLKETAAGNQKGKEACPVVGSAQRSATAAVSGQRC